MACIVLNGTSFHEDWAGGTIAYLLPENSRVLIIPLSSNDEWGADARNWEMQFRKGRRQYEALVRPFRAYGIKDEQIRWINYYTDDEESASIKIRNSDVIYLVGSNPAWMMQRLEDLGIAEAIRRFRGTLMCGGRGSIILLEAFRPYGDEEDYEIEGLGRLDQFHMIPDYNQTESDLYYLIRLLEDGEKPVIVTPAKSGAVIDGDYFELLGDGMLVRPSDLDAIYQALADREEY